jgi:hypothetical protein
MSSNNERQLAVDSSRSAFVRTSGGAGPKIALRLHRLWGRLVWLGGGVPPGRESRR